MNEKKKMKGLPKRILSFVLTLAMVLTLMPEMTVLASEEESETFCISSKRRYPDYYDGMYATMEICDGYPDIDSHSSKITQNKWSYDTSTHTLNLYDGFTFETSSSVGMFLANEENAKFTINIEGNVKIVGSDFGLYINEEAIFTGEGTLTVENTSDDSFSAYGSDCRPAALYCYSGMTISENVTIIAKGTSAGLDGAPIEIKDTGKIIVTGNRAAVLSFNEEIDNGTNISIKGSDKYNFFRNMAAVENVNITDAGLQSDDLYGDGYYTLMTEDKVAKSVLMVNIASDDFSVPPSLLHEHTWAYKADGAILKAYCTETEGADVCDHQGSATDLSKAVSLTLSASSAVYSGSETYSASFSDTSAWTSAGLTVPTIKYYKATAEGGTEGTEEVTELTGLAVGNYYAAVTMGTATAKAAFSITPVTPLAPAGEEYPIFIYSGESYQQVKESNKNDVLGDGGKVSFDPEKNTLTLSGAAICTGAENTTGDAIYCNLPKGETLTINLIGSNVIGKAPSAEWESFNIASGISSKEGAKLLLKGDEESSLTIYAGESGIKGLYISLGEVVENFKGKLKIYSLKTGIQAGEETAEGEITIYGGDIDIKSKENGLYADENVAAYGSKIKIDAGGNGIHSKMFIELSDVTLNVITANTGSEEMCFAVNAETRLNITGSAFRIVARSQPWHGTRYGAIRCFEVTKPEGTKVFGSTEWNALEESITSEAAFSSVWSTFKIGDNFAQAVILHICSVEQKSGQAATCTEDGWNDYYQCTNTSCSKIYASSSAIGTFYADLAEWKASSEGKKERLGHNWIYTASGAALTATCERDASHTATLTLTASSANYSGISGLSEFNAATGKTIAESDVTFYKVETEGATIDGSLVDGTLTEEGYYYASLTVEGQTAVKAFTIGNPGKTVSLSIIEGNGLLDPMSPIYIDNREVINGEVTVDQIDDHEIIFQVAFGCTVSKVIVNDNEYEITDLGEGKIQVSSVPDAASYNVKLVAGESVDVTIMWSYDTEDADRDYYVNHGKVEVISITRGEDTVFDDTNESEDVRIDEHGGWVALKKGDDVVLKLIPDYGYQLESVTINDQELEPQENVSVFSLPDIQGNLHFKGVFVEASDKITDSSAVVSDIGIANGRNAASTGNLSLEVSDNSSYSADVSSVVSGMTTKVASIDISLENIVSKGNGQSGEDGWWTTNITEFENPIQLGLKVDSTTLAEGETYSIVRDHNGTLSELEHVTYDASTGELSFETNKFSTYTIVKKTAGDIKTVTYNANGHGTAPASIEVISGEKLTPPANPTASGYTFAGWYKEAACTSAWNFNTDTVTENITLYAKWNQNSGGGGGYIPPSNPDNNNSGNNNSGNTITVPVENGSQSSKVTIEIKDNVAVVDTINDDVIKDTVEKGTTDTITIDASAANTDVHGTALDKQTAEKIADVIKDTSNKVENLEIKTPQATITLDGTALQTVADAAGAATDLITLVVDDVNNEMNGLTSVQQNAIKDTKPLATFDAYILAGKSRVHDLKGGVMTVAVEYPFPNTVSAKDVKLVHMLNDGGTEVLEWKVVTENGKKLAVFKTKSLSYFMFTLDENGVLADAAANALTMNAALKVSQTGSRINVSWGKVEAADGYVVYAAYCGKKLAKIETIADADTTSLEIAKLDGKKLDLKKNYKVRVVAYKLVDGKKTRIGKTIIAHVVGRKDTKYTNAKSIKLTSADKVTLKAGKTAKIKATIVPVNAEKKQLSDAHAKEFRYASSDTSIATVNANGKITAKKAGQCTIYVYAKNGYAKKVTVTVK